MSAGATGLPTADAPWRTLDRRLLLVQLKWLLPPLLSVLFSVVVVAGRFDRAAVIRLAIITACFAAIMLWRLVELLTTRYRLLESRLEVRRGFLGRRSRTVPFDRVRRVDLTADPFHRVFGLAVVRIATGQAGGSEESRTTLEALPHAEAERIRATMLRRAGEAGRDDTGVLARMDLAWLRFTPLTGWGAAGVVILFTMGVRALEGLGVPPESVLRATLGMFGTTRLWQTVVVAAVVVVVLGSVMELALGAENWWRYRLHRDDDGTLSVRRGLLTTRALSLDAARLRGVEIVEPLLLRWGGGARVAAVATGLQQESDDQAGKLQTLTPDMPRARADEVAAAIVGLEVSPAVDVVLAAHPRAALRRRRVRAVLAVGAPALALGVAGALWSSPVLVTVAWAGAIVVLPAGWWVAGAAYGALGHGVSGSHLVVRCGVLVRRTTALERSGVIGWTVRSSPLQRRAGLVTLVATTATGKRGALRVRDVTPEQALALAEEAVPGLLTPFLHRGPQGS